MIETTTLSVMDLRRAPTQAPLIHRVNRRGGKKTLTFTFYTGDLWEANPDAHMWIITDGYIATGEPTKSLQGRGITVGHTNHCAMGVGFEMFGENNGYPNLCMPVDFRPNEFYDFVIETTGETVTVSVNGETISHVFSKTMPSYDTVVGVAGDSDSATYGFFNMIQTIEDGEVEPPIGDYDYELDMAVSNHIDTRIGIGETKVFRFTFSERVEQLSTHISTVLLATGPCIKFEIPEYGHKQTNCHEETSETIATDSTHTSWVVPKGEHVYLHVINTGASGTVRLSWGKEQPY